MSILKSVFGGGNKTIAKYEKFIYPCKSCGKKLPLKELTPLSMSNCPKCDDLFLVPCKLGDWWITSPLGSGGMGAVYLAESNGKNKKAAVKVLKHSGKVNSFYLETLIEEAKIASSFGQQPNLCEIYDYDNNGDRAYVIMGISRRQTSRFSN